MKLPRRAIGLETELDIPVENLESNSIESSRYVSIQTIRDAEMIHRGFSNAGTEGAEYWSPNGSKWYLDRTYLELATAEAPSAKDAIALSRAGIDDIIQVVSFRDEWDYCTKGIRHVISGTPRVFAINQDTETDNTRGAHENYQLRARNLHERLRNVEENNIFEYLGSKMLPFLVARQIISGGGGIDLGISSTCDAKYVISPRSLMLKAAMSLNTTTASDGIPPARGILNTRTEHHSDVRFRRLHLICGDPNMSEYAEYLKIGVTSLVLDLIENSPLPDLRLTDAVRDIIGVSRDLTGKNYKIRFENGRAYSAVDVLKIYQKLIHENIARHLDDERLHVLNEFDDTIRALQESNPLDLYDRFDYALKFHLLNRTVLSKGHNLDSPHAKKILVKYHEKGPGGLFERVSDKLGHIRILSPEDTARFRGKEGQPPRSRAKGRQRFIDWGTNQGYVENVTWERVTVRGSEKTILSELGKKIRPTYQMVFSDPLDPCDDMELP